MSSSPVARIRVLHVDDDPALSELTATILEERHDRFSVETVDNAEDALDRLADRPPDCIVSDYEMPRRDGIELLEAVRNTHPELPFILYTGKGSEAIASDAISAGVTDYLQKGTGTERYELLANRIENAVTARRNADRVTRHKQLMRLTELAGDTGGWELDLDTDDLFVTDGTRRLFDVPDGHTLTMDEVIDAFHSDDRNPVRNAIERAAKTGEETAGTWRLSTADGQNRIVEMSIMPVSTPPRKPVSTLRGTLHDVTAHKRREEELERQVDRLEEFTGVVSHDLRNPLTIAQGRLELAAANCDCPHLDEIAESLDRMEAIIDDSLLLARQGQHITDPEPIPLAELVDRAWGGVDTGDSTLQIDTEAVVQADRSRLLQLFENLFRNAIDHNPDPVTVRVGEVDVLFTSTRGGTGDTIELYVEDDGVGVPPGRRESVFDPGESTQETGTGFGLAIVKRIAEAHGWELSLTDGVDGGVRFTFSNVE